MTAIDKYLRLETTGHWREGGAEPREVLVSFGNETLVLSNFDESPLAHWALAAIRRLELQDGRAIYSPDVEGFETLEIEDPEMIEAITQVSRLRAGPVLRRKWERWFLALLGVGAIGAAVYFTPSVLRGQALKMTTADSARLLGWKMAETLELQLCNTADGDIYLEKLGKTAFPEGGYTLQIIRNGPDGASFPGGLILIGQGALGRMTSPAQLVDWGQRLSQNRPPMARIFNAPALMDVFSYVTSGALPPEALQKAADSMLATTATDMTELPAPSAGNPVLSAPEWAALQKICQE